MSLRDVVLEQKRGQQSGQEGGVAVLERPVHEDALQAHISLQASNHLKRELVQRLGLGVVAHLAGDADTDRARRELSVTCQTILNTPEYSMLSPEQRALLIGRVLDDICGLGPLQELLEDDEVRRHVFLALLPDPPALEREDDVDVRCRIRKQRGVEFLELKSETVSPSKKQLVEILVRALPFFQQAPIIGHATESHVAFGDVRAAVGKSQFGSIRLAFGKGERIELDLRPHAIVQSPCIVVDLLHDP